MLEATSPCRGRATGEDGLDDLLNIQGFIEGREVVWLATREPNHPLDLAPERVRRLAARSVTRWTMGPERWSARWCSMFSRMEASWEA